MLLKKIVKDKRMLKVFEKGGRGAREFIRMGIRDSASYSGRWFLFMCM